MRPKKITQAGRPATQSVESSVKNASTPESVTDTATQNDRFAVRPSHALGGALLALALFLSSVVIGGAAASGVGPTDGILFGAASGARGGQTQIGAIQELEGQLGGKLPLVRTFARWDTKLDNSLREFIIDGDRRMMVSIKPQRDNGQIITWRSIANARPGSQLHNEMVEMARDIRSLNGDVWVAFHHEPEAGADSEAWGSPDDFQAAWRNFHTVFQQQNAGVEFVWTMTGWSFAVNTADRRSAFRWYPGDAYVDYLGADVYNWNQCRNSRETWRSLKDAIDPFVEWGNRNHPNKPLVLPEFGVHGSASAKAGWLDDARALLKSSPYKDRFAAVIYFDSIDTGAPGCNWPLDSSSASLAAAQRIARDPFFQESGSSSTPSPTTTRAPAPTTTTTRAPAPAPVPAPSNSDDLTPIAAVGGCVVQAIDGSDRVTWTPQGNNFTYNVRRNGSWLDKTGGNTWQWNYGVTAGNYEVIARGDGNIAQLSCRREAAVNSRSLSTNANATTIPAIGGCRVDRIDGSDRVTWPIQGSGFSYEVYHNGQSIATTPNTWQWNQNITSGEYVVEATLNNGVATLNCRRR